MAAGDVEPVAGRMRGLEAHVEVVHTEDQLDRVLFGRLVGGGEQTGRERATAPSHGPAMPARRSTTRPAAGSTPSSQAPGRPRRPSAGPPSIALDATSARTAASRGWR